MMRKLKKKRIIRRGKKRNWNKTDCISVFNNCKKKKTGKIGRRGNFNDPFLSFLFFLFFPQLKTNEDRCRIAPQKKWLLRDLRWTTWPWTTGSTGLRRFSIAISQLFEKLSAEKKNERAGTWKVGTWMEAERKLPNLPADNSRPP